MDLSKIELNEQFSQALLRMEDGEGPLFVTGRAGTGKSTLLEYFRATTKRRVVVLAPTGVAAVNVGGQTLHSFFKFRPDITVEKAERAARKAIREKRAGIYRKLDTLVIDEISMVRADLFDCADRFLRVAREAKGRPFGGAQLVCIGDLYQLPPVVTSREAKIFDGHYPSPYFFDSHVCRGMKLKILELEKVYRQRDDRFIALLNAIRNNTAGDDEIAALNERCEPGADAAGDGQITLTALNREADAINTHKLASLPGRARHYRASVTGEFDAKASPAGEDVELKVGAQVMLLNNDAQGRWVNGTIGQVRLLGGESVEVCLPDGSCEEVEPFTWQMFHFDLDPDGRRIVSREAGTFTQIPVALAWAVTIHKGQGKTFDRAVVDIGRAFACGQAYVALSRVRSFEGLTLKTRLRKGHVRVDRRVMAFLTGHRYAISEESLPLDEKIRIIEEAIRERESLEIVYLKASDETSRRVIRPLEVGDMEYAGKIFPGVRGTCRLRDEERVFRVDRILEMKVVR